VLGRHEELTRGRVLAGNVVVNLAGWVLPGVAALVATPVLYRSLGPARFGLLTLAWTLVGYFSLFDLGVGRALTQALAERAGAGDEAESPAVTWTSVWLLAPFGAACGLALAAAAPALVDRVLDVPVDLRPEAVQALRLVAACVPFLVLTSALRGVLEAAQRFRLINLLRVPVGVATFLGPVAVLPFSRGLPAAVAVLAVGRALLCGLHAAAVWRTFPPLRRVRRPRGGDLARLWRSAGWMTVSSVVSPVLVSADRFAVGALLPAAALAHYATASEVATKLWLFTAALLPVLFPAFAATLAADPRRAAALFDRGVRVTALALAPPALALVLFAREVLAAWMGPAFARDAAPVLQLLAVAVFVNSVAQVPYTVLHGAGRADLAAKLHLAELPIYAAMLWWIPGRLGLVGVAVAWLARMAGDGLAMSALAGRAIPPARAAARRAAVVIATGGALLAAGTTPAPLGVRVAVWLAAALAIAGFGWTRALTPAERSFVRGVVARAAARRDVAEAAPGA
jgi:O-antigen/teichoic acid export membrane protein